MQKFIFFFWNTKYSIRFPLFNIMENYQEIKSWIVFFQKKKSTKFAFKSDKTKLSNVNLFQKIKKYENKLLVK